MKLLQVSFGRSGALRKKIQQLNLKSPLCLSSKTQIRKNRRFLTKSLLLSLVLFLLGSPLRADYKDRSLEANLTSLAESQEPDASNEPRALCYFHYEYITPRMHSAVLAQDNPFVFVLGPTQIFGIPETPFAVVVEPVASSEGWEKISIQAVNTVTDAKVEMKRKTFQIPNSSLQLIRTSAHFNQWTQGQLSCVHIAVF